jgi:hypothetical protein
MKCLIILFSVIILLSSSLKAQEERKVLVEVFTNSHCPLCPPAHNVIDDYLAGPNGNKIGYIFYHMIYPYNDDPLYWQSQEGSDVRDNYYNPVSATPQSWFDGVHQGSTSSWTTSLDNLVATESPLKIILSGTKNPNQFFINAELTRTGNFQDNDLVIHFVIVEDLFFDGRNSVSNHKHVMRRMLPTPDGQSFTINLNETINFAQSIDLNPIWDADSLSVIVFVQSLNSKTVYQSATIIYDELTVTGVLDEISNPIEFKLEQNYPNPFNPTTTISWQSPVGSYQTVKVYDLLGREVATLVDEYKPAGIYETTFNASKLANGIYFYEVRAGDYSEIKKMILLK